MKHFLQLTAAIMFLVVCFFIQVSFCQTLASLNFKSSDVVSAGYPYTHLVGLSMYFPQIIPYLNNSLFLSRIHLSDFNNNYFYSDNTFHLSVHMPKGYKYNCSSTIYSATVSCIKDFAIDTATTKLMVNFVTNLSFSTNLDWGYDIQKSNFSNSKYLSNFKSYLKLFGSTYFTLQLIDNGNLINSIYNRTYTVTDLINDVAILNSAVNIPINAPGITESADSSWVNQLPNLSSNYYVTFTFRCIVFHNSSQATIANLLSQNYSKVYLNKRLVDSTGSALDLSTYSVGINEIRLTNDSGVDGVTNSFAAALWALDISMEFAAMHGSFINFYNPLIASNQSIFGPGPDFSPTPILYGLLFAIYALRDSPEIQLTQITGGTSQNIKTYGLNLYQNYRILIINKDTNHNASGVVNIVMDYPDGLRCYYLTAPDLTSTAGVTFAGMSFIGNNSDYIGQFVYYEYFQQNGPFYQINVNYSQAVLCQKISSGSYYQIPRGRGRNYQPFTFFCLCLISILLLLS